MTAMTDIREKPEPECGTPAAANRHYYLREPLDPACKAIHAARVREHRAKHGRYDRQINRARQRAVNQLAREHPERLTELYELAKVEVFAEAKRGAS